VLENLPADTLPRLLRRTAVSALVVGAIGFVVAVIVAPPAGALGELLGVAGAVVNLRFLDRQSAKVELAGAQSQKAIRRQLRGKTTGRLLVITVVALALVWLDPPLGIGIVSGLVIYQIVFVANVLRVVAGQGGVE
jgi:membrane associated rhomboid family serine protease